MQVWPWLSRLVALGGDRVGAVDLGVDAVGDGSKAPVLDLSPRETLQLRRDLAGAEGPMGHGFDGVGQRGLPW
jgi:hypothetical protein